LVCDLPFCHSEELKRSRKKAGKLTKKDRKKIKTGKKKKG
jgi:hypothetical protein